MRSYTKRQPPVELAAWQPNTHAWSDFVQVMAAYQPVKAALLAEQQQICCYCESSLTERNCHIEHFQPRYGTHGDTTRTFVYANLACSCNGGTGDNDHCGHFKGAEYDAALFVNPSSEDSSRLFLYTPDGRISEAPGLSSLEQSHAHYMVRILNLDCPRLRGMRRNYAASLLEAIEGFLKAGAADQIEELAVYCLTPDTNGKLHSFFSLSRQMLGACADTVLEVLGE